jgi:hypothetical protein
MHHMLRNTRLTISSFGFLGSLLAFSRLASAEVVAERVVTPTTPPAEDIDTADVERLEADEARAVSQGIDLAYQSGSSRSVSNEFLVLPSGQELTTSLRLVTADESIGQLPLKMTDLAMLDLGFHVSLSKKIDAKLEVSLLPKQPSYTNQGVWQGASFVLRGQVANRHAIGAKLSGGPMLDEKGLWASGSVFAERKQRLNDVVTFDIAVGGAATTMRSKSDDPIRVAEVTSQAALLLRVPCNCFGAWMSAGYSIPVYARGPVMANMPMASGGAVTPLMRIDPQPRLDLSVGMSAKLNNDWNAFTTASIVDRGDLTQVQTLLPVLDGGFDQIQLVFGMSRNLDLFTKKKTGIADPMIMM